MAYDYTASSDIFEIVLLLILFLESGIVGSFETL